MWYRATALLVSPLGAAELGKQDDALDARPSHLVERHRELLVAAEEEYGLNSGERRSETRGPVEIARNRLDAYRPCAAIGSHSHEGANSVSVCEKRSNNRPARIPGRSGHEEHH
jgi:hypothetical protein